MFCPITFSEKNLDRARGVKIAVCPHLSIFIKCSLPNVWSFRLDNQDSKVALFQGLPHAACYSGLGYLWHFLERCVHVASPPNFDLEVDWQSTESLILA